MRRRAIDLIGVTQLDDPSEIHHGDAIADVADHGQIVRNEQHGEVSRAAHILEHVEHLGLHGHIECRDRFVQDEQLRLEHHRTGDGDALALSARELPWAPLAHAVRVETDLAHHALHALARLVRGNPADREPLGDDILDPTARVQRRDRILEDHLHPPQHLPHATR